MDIALLTVNTVDAYQVNKWSYNSFLRFNDIFQDIDECDLTNPSHDCVDLAKCDDTIESYTCTCNEGYIGDGIQNGTECKGTTNNFSNLF